MKIKAKNPALKSSKLIIPFDGCIDIDSNCIVDVSDAAAEVLVKNTNDWEYTDAPVIQSESESITAGIKAMSIKDMISMATEAGYPDSEWSKFSTKPKLMAGYLIKKYNEAQFEAEAGEEDAE